MRVEFDDAAQVHYLLAKYGTALDYIPAHFNLGDLLAIICFGAALIPDSAFRILFGRHNCALTAASTGQLIYTRTALANSN